MASVSGVNSSSSSSSILGNRNVITGLSGLDTEGMIEQAVSGYQSKIESLQQQQTKVQWQQDALRSIIDKAYGFSQKYTSYTSSTNMLSASFFNNAVKVSSAGKYAGMISASGKTSSNIQILGVKQLATAAKYSVSFGGAGSGSAPAINGESIDLNENVSKISGTLNLTYGGHSIKLELDDTAYSSAQELADALNAKLNAYQLDDGKGGSAGTAGSMITASVGSDGNIKFEGAASVKVEITGATGDIKETLGIDPSAKSDTLKTNGAALTEKRWEALADQEVTFTLDGVSKTIKLPGAADDSGFVQGLQNALDKAFGTGKVTVADKDSSGKVQLSFEIKNGSTLSAESEVGKLLGLASNEEGSYTNTNRTLGELVGTGAWDPGDRIKVDGDRKEVTANGETYYVDSSGNRIKEDGGEWYRVDSKGEYLYDFKVNDVSVGAFSKNSTLDDVLSAINSNQKAGVSASFSKTTNQFQFTAKESGVSGRVEFGGALASGLFGGGTMVNGQDAILSMSVNGMKYTNIARSDNSFEVDGLTLNLTGTFGYDDTGALDTTSEAVTFTSSTDSDKIIDAIKSMVEDYNAMAAEIKTAYATMPLRKDSAGNPYQPLTEKDKATMSESAIKNYEEKAKQGILFGDRDLSNFYSELTEGLSAGSLQGIGIELSFDRSSGMSTLTVDEEKLRSTLESDPDRVKDVLTSDKSKGGEYNGLMTSLKNTLDLYTGTTGASKGILVNKAGTTKSATSLLKNEMQDKLDSYDEEISRWQDKLENRVDYYTRQFSLLEQLMVQMNSQSSMLSGLMGGMGG